MATKHRFKVNRRLFYDDAGNVTGMSPYWRLDCVDCDWTGTRISKPGISQTRNRVEEWRKHEQTAGAVEGEVR